jgi:hypothetical protein
MISSNQIEWNGLISKEGRGIDDADFGEIIQVDSDNVITERSVIDKERFSIPKQEVQGYDNNKVHFKLTEEEAMTLYLRRERTGKLTGSE